MVLNKSTIWSLPGQFKNSSHFWRGKKRTRCHTGVAAGNIDSMSKVIKKTVTRSVALETYGEDLQNHWLSHYNGQWCKLLCDGSQLWNRARIICKNPEVVLGSSWEPRWRKPWSMEKSSMDVMESSFANGVINWISWRRSDVLLWSWCLVGDIHSDRLPITTLQGSDRPTDSTEIYSRYLLGEPQHKLYQDW